MSLVSDLQAEAERLGFFFLGVTAPVTPPHYSAYISWLDNNYHAGMEYLSRPESRLKRADPALLLPNIQSIIILGRQYPSPVQSLIPPSDDAFGRIASYAWVEDYHLVIPPLLQHLADLFSKFSGHTISSRAFTDSAPILERDYASQAGLGWIGKNTCLISPRNGSFFFLSELMVNLELPRSLPFTFDRCGSCTACMDICPTGCILPNRVLDSSRCISYLTIENRGVIPIPLRPLIGNWIFGCDLCQIVCPWNRKPSRLNPTIVSPPSPILLDELSLSPEEFSRRYSRSPIMRSKRSGYLRNVCVALGNSKQPSSVPHLARAMQHDSEPLVRSHAAWALGQLNSSSARSHLSLAYQSEPDFHVREEISRALANSG
jgi:epoxyqueuosine reductase